MNIYLSLFIVGSVATALSAYLPPQTPDNDTSVVRMLVTALSLIFTFISTKNAIKKEHDDEIHKLTKQYEDRIHDLRKEYDTATLERMIREGSQTLIKNTLDYFKLENIKNEMGYTAAIANIQLDKYAQIIELLADFSMILPDTKENQLIVQREIIHQIAIYQIDEKPFSMFLQRIMDHYIITLNKKIAEQIIQNNPRPMKTSPKYEERKLLKDGHKLKTTAVRPFLKVKIQGQMGRGKNCYRSGYYREAINAFTRVIELKPDYAAGYYNRAVVYYKIGNKDAAENDLREASELGYKKADKLLDKKKVEAG